MVSVDNKYCLHSSFFSEILVLLFLVCLTKKEGSLVSILQTEVPAEMDDRKRGTRSDDISIVIIENEKKEEEEITSST